MYLKMRSEKLSWSESVLLIAKRISPSEQALLNSSPYTSLLKPFPYALIENPFVFERLATISSKIFFLFSVHCPIKTMLQSFLFDTGLN